MEAGLVSRAIAAATSRAVAQGLRVDDAVVMVENISRHIDEGMAPMEAALKGSGEIGYTIVSITVSLVAVFIPVMLMGGVVGRIFHAAAAPVGSPWMWTLAYGFHEDRNPTHGYEPTREAAMAAFAKSWRRS